MVSKVTQVNLSTNQKQTHIENKLVVAKGGGVERGMAWEFGISKYKPLYIEWITTGIYSMAQGTIINIL